MALKLVQAKREPFGQFDGLDSITGTIKGGEVCTFGSVVSPNPPGTDKASSDSFDGYSDPSGVQHRAVITTTLASGNRPLMLTDDGVLGYGTLLGTVVGAVAGQVSVGGAVIGPSTTSGSGKITCWDGSGIYAVSLDACDTNAVTGLQPTNYTLDTGNKLYATAAGLLTPNSASSFEASLAVGRFIDFDTSGSLVTTPSTLVAALNSPSGNVSSLGSRSFSFATFYFYSMNG